VKARQRFRFARWLCEWISSVSNHWLWYYLYVCFCAEKQSRFLTSGEISVELQADWCWKAHTATRRPASRSQPLSNHQRLFVSHTLLGKDQHLLSLYSTVTLMLPVSSTVSRVVSLMINELIATDAIMHDQPNGSAGLYILEWVC